MAVHDPGYFDTGDGHALTFCVPEDRAEEFEDQVNEILRSPAHTGRWDYRNRPPIGEGEACVCRVDFLVSDESTTALLGILFGEFVYA